MRAPIALDLFAGCGGLTLGLRQAGFLVVAAVEIDPLAVETYRANHPHTSVWHQDIRGLTVRAVMESLRIEKGDLDLLAGCPPCEGFSSIRTLNGARRVVEPRNDLVFEFLRFVRVLRPKTLMLENVPGLATDWRMGVIRDQLARLGYVVRINVLDVAAYGVPQRRRRMILLGSQNGKIRLARRATKRRTVRDTLGFLRAAGSSGDLLHDFPERRTPRVTRLIRSIPLDGGSRSDLSRRRQLRCHKQCDGFSDVYGRMAWDDVAPTITGGCVNPSKGRFLHPEHHRTITLREAALLQSFPRDYFFSVARGKFAAADMIGNALPAEFVRRHAVNIKRDLERAHRSQ